MIIRRLLVADATIYKAICIEATEEAPTTMNSTVEEEIGRPLGHFQAKLSGPDCIIFGAFDAGQLVAITGLRRDPGVKMRHTVVLGPVYVRPAYRRRGMAKQLLDAALDFIGRIAEASQVKLAVHTDNIPAQCLYASYGFRTYGSDPQVIHVGDAFFDEYLMVLTLK